MNRRTLTIVVSAAVTVAAVTTGAAPVSAAALPKVAFTAQAYGTLVTIGGVVRSGPTALSAIGCTTLTGRSANAGVATVTLPVVGSVGGVTSSARTAETLTSKSSSSTANVTGVNLLGGQVRASALGTSSGASISATSTFSGSNQSTLTGLVISGRSVSAATPPNTRIRVFANGAGIATAIVNRQERVVVGTEYRVATTALTVIVDGQNSFGLPIGSRVDVAPSTAFITKPVSGLVGGKGFSTSAQLASGAVSSSPTALAYPRCLGGSSSAHLAGAQVPGLVSTGTTQTTTSSSVTSTARSVAVNADISGPNVLAGIITAQTLQARTSAAQTAGGLPQVGDTSRFVGLKVTGAPAITDSVAPNTVVTLPNLGRVTLHKVTRSATSIEVVMIEVVLNQSIGGPPTGSVVRVGYSQSALV